ncbi:MAG: DUF3467 domain-containing protein [Pirellulales bacterium]|nr:DUF3467 domain-containing protein [Pirellulales bacterium]
MAMENEAGAPEAGAAQRQQIQVNDSKVVASYANFCRVTGTPEELIVDFALNPQPMGIPAEPINISNRIVLNFFTAKRLLVALSMSVQRHEQAFGVLETDVQKRVVPTAYRQPGQQS